MSEFKDISIEEYKNLNEKEKTIYNFMILQDISACLKKKCIGCSTTRNVKWHWIIILAIITSGVGFGKYLLNRLDAHEISQTDR